MHFFDFRLYNRNYDGREDRQHMDGKRSWPRLRDTIGWLTQPSSHLVYPLRSGGRLIGAIDRL